MLYTISIILLLQVLSELTLSVTAVISMIDLHVLNKCLGTLLEGTSSTSSSVSASLVRIGQNEFGATLLNELLTRGLSHIATDDRPNQMERDLETWYVYISTKGSPPSLSNFPLMWS